jgi:hypothetical protein
MTLKKDILEFPLEELEVPQAIGLMMQAASNTREAVMVVDGKVTLRTNDDMLQLLCEKLEARVEDALDAARSSVIAEVEEDATDEEPVEWSDVVLLEDGDILNVKGVVYQRACNKPVVSGQVTDDTFCVLRWGHRGDLCMDMNGEFRG